MIDRPAPPALLLCAACLLTGLTAPATRPAAAGEDDPPIPAATSDGALAILLTVDSAETFDPPDGAVRLLSVERSVFLTCEVANGSDQPVLRRAPVIPWRDFSVTLTGPDGQPVPMSRFGRGNVAAVSTMPARGRVRLPPGAGRARAALFEPVLRSLDAGGI